MTMSELSKDDVWRMASALREIWGERVYDEVESRLNELRQRNNHRELVVWYLVREAVDAQIAQERPPQSALH